MKTFSIQEAETQLSKLLELAAKNEEVIITNDGIAVARLVAVAPVKRPRRFGTLKGKIRIADDFDAPLPEHILAEFEGR